MTVSLFCFSLSLSKLHHARNLLYVFFMKFRFKLEFCWLILSMVLNSCLMPNALTYHRRWPFLIRMKEVMVVSNAAMATVRLKLYTHKWIINQPGTYWATHMCWSSQLALWCICCITLDAFSYSWTVAVIMEDKKRD